MRLDVAGLGEAMLLFHPPAGESLPEAKIAEIGVAGAELNTCAAVARFGLTAALCSRVGDDPAGERVRRRLAELDVADDLLVTDPERPTGLFVRELLADGARRAHYYRAGSAASRLDVADAHRLLAARPRVAVVSGLTAALGPGPERCVATVLAGDVHVAVDANLRPALGRLDRVIDLLSANLHRMDTLILGLDEAEHVFGSTDPEQVLHRAEGTDRGQGSGNGLEVVVKAGADGAYYLDDDGKVVHVPALAERVVDPVGAGDAFTGSYLAARLRGLDRARAVQVASRVAAGVVETAGDNSGLPTRAEAAGLLSDQA